MDKTNLQVIRESFGRVAYSHKTHEKAAELDYRSNKIAKWLNIMLTTLTFGSLASSIIADEVILLYISAALSALTLGFMIFFLSFNPSEKAERHRSTARELWLIREKYISLIADIIDERVPEEVIRSTRDSLIEDLNLIYKFAPSTDAKAYRAAREALKINEELTFSEKEIDELLPEELRISANLTKNT